MNNFEQEWIASERIRERMYEAAHERMARRVRRPADRRAGGRRLRMQAAFAALRRLVRAAQAV